LLSFNNGNPLVTNGLDALLRIAAVVVLLLPAGRVCSLDARRRGPLVPAPEQLWPLRLFELQVSVVMLAAALWKAKGSDWTNGSALHYVTGLRGFWGNWPVPGAFTESPALLAAATYLTLGLELSLPFAAWVPSLRRPALVVAVGFHLALAYAMNLFLFPWIMILGWCSFLRTTDLDLARRAFSLRRLRAVRFPTITLQRTRP
jgi:hypothetical protein